jgi:hypothetical protein
MQARLSGQEWQTWANQLLARHYGPTEYQKVPDADRGDAGIEGFTLTGGHAYQAYGCLEPLAVKARYEKQRDKITEDVNKFINNQAKLSRLFGNVRITRWVLFVPFFDSKDLVEHATKKTDEVIRANLCYTCPTTFQVMIADEEQFAAERDSLMNVGTMQIEFFGNEREQGEIDQWVMGHDELVATLDRKVGLLPTIRTEGDRFKFREKLLRHYLEGQDTWELLRKFPTIHERVFQAKRQRERFLESSWMIHSGPNNELMERALNQFMESVKTATKGLDMFTVEALAWEAVADWMLRCPLDFPGVATHV